MSRARCGRRVSLVVTIEVDRDSDARLMPVEDDRAGLVLDSVWMRHPRVDEKLAKARLDGLVPGARVHVLDGAMSRAAEGPQSVPIQRRATEVSGTGHVRLLHQGVRCVEVAGFEEVEPPVPRAVAV